jgi:hypothetical protein
LSTSVARCQSGSLSIRQLETTLPRKSESNTFVESVVLKSLLPFNAFETIWQKRFF